MYLCFVLNHTKYQFAFNINLTIKFAVKNIFLIVEMGFDLLCRFRKRWCRLKVVMHIDQM